MLLDRSLVDEQADRGGCITNRSRSHVDDEFHEPPDTDVLPCGGAEHGHNLPLGQTGTQTGTDLVDGKFHGLEILLHEGVVTFGGLLYKLHVKLFGLVSIFGGNLKLLEVAVLVLEAIVLHGEDVHDTVETKTEAATTGSVRWFVMTWTTVHHRSPCPSSSPDLLLTR